MSVLRPFFGVVQPDEKSLRGSTIVQGKQYLEIDGKRVCARCNEPLKGNPQLRGGPYQYDFCNACGVRFMNSYYYILDNGRLKPGFFQGTTEQQIKNLAYDCAKLSKKDWVQAWNALPRLTSFDEYERRMRKIIGDHVVIPGELPSPAAHAWGAGAADATADADAAAKNLEAQQNELAEQQRQAAARAAEQREAEQREAEQREAERREAERREAERREAERREAERREAERLKKEQSDAAERKAAAARQITAERRKKNAEVSAKFRATAQLVLDADLLAGKQRDAADRLARQQSDAAERRAEQQSAEQQRAARLAAASFVLDEEHADRLRTESSPGSICNAETLEEINRGYFGSQSEERVFDHVYANGDLHGDIQLFFEFLKMCNIATFNRDDYKNPNIRWMLDSKGAPRTNIAIILVGDIIDRFRPHMATSINNGVESSVGEVQFEEKYLERAINDLSLIAPTYNSVVIKLFGNHEFLNRMEPLDGPYNRHGPQHYMSPFLQQTYSARYPSDPSPVYSRVKEFQPGGIMNHEVAECNPAVIFQLNHHVFVHGGISIASIDYAEKNKRHLYEFANTVSAAVWGGTATQDERYHFHKLCWRQPENEGSLLWDRTFSEALGPERQPNMSEYISEVIRRLNEHNEMFHVPAVVGIVVAHTWPGLNPGSISDYEKDSHFLCRKNGTDGAGYVIFADTAASRSFMSEVGDQYAREQRVQYRARPLHISRAAIAEMMYYDVNNNVITWPVAPTLAPPVPPPSDGAKSVRV